MTDRILINGRIYTENPEMPWAQALAISGSKLVYVGTDDGAKAVADGNTEIVDLEGKMVIPSLIEGHTHLASVSNTHWYARGPLTADRDELRENIRRAAEQHPKGEMPYFYYESYLTTTFGEEGPNKVFVDEIISDRPARIQDFGDHACVYNSIALDMLKDEKGIPHSRGISGDGEFIKDKNGEYTGWCLETQIVGDGRIFEKIGWKPDDVMNDEKTTPLLDHLRHYGIAALFDATIEGEDNLKYIHSLDVAGKLNMYYDGAVLLEQVSELDSTIAKYKEWKKKYTTDHIRVNVIKFFIDGTNEMGDMLSTEPFHNDPEGKYCGFAFATMEEMRDVIVRLNRERIDYHVHTICDGAFRLMCDAVEEAKKICGDDWFIKVTLCHCELIHPDDIHRVKELGIYIDYSTQWAGGYFGEGAVPYLGRERWEAMHDYTGIIADGGKVGFSSDIFSYVEASRSNPMFGMQMAMTRVDPWVPVDPERYPGSIRPPLSARLPIEYLIHGYTAVNAERMRIDDKMGSLEAGKLANFIVFNEDIFEAAHNSPETFGDIHPAYTCYEGRDMHYKTTLNYKQHLR